MPLRPMVWPFDGVADFHVERRQVPVQRLHAEAVIDEDPVPIDPQPTRVQHRAVVRRHDRHVCRHRQVESQMDLPIDFLALIEVRAMVGEAGFDLRVAQLDEGTAPQSRRRGLVREAPRSRRRCTSQLAVDRRGSRQQVFAGRSVSFSFGEWSRISGTTRLMNLSSSSMRLCLNGFVNTLSTKLARDVVGRFVACERQTRALRS